MTIDTLSLVSAIKQSENHYVWLEGTVDDEMRTALRACAVPISFTRDLAQFILRSDPLGLERSPEEVLPWIISLPFIHSRSNGVMRFSSDARRYFDEQLRNDGINYQELNSLIATYIADRFRTTEIESDGSSAMSRNASLQVAYHLLAADPDKGIENLTEFVINSPNESAISDTLAAIRVSEYQRRYIPDDYEETIWFIEGLYHYRRGDYDSALPLLQPIADSGRTSLESAIANHLIGVIHRNRGMVEDAMHRLDQSLEIGRSLNEHRHIIHVLITLGTVHRDLRDDLEKAQDTLEEAARLAREYSADMIAHSLNTLATVYRDQGNYPLAVETLKECVDNARALGDTRTQAMGLNTLASVYRRSDELEEAKGAFEKAVGLVRSLRDDEFLARILIGLALVHLEFSRPDNARAAAEEAQRLLKDHDDLEQLARCQYVLGKAYQASGLLAEASRAFETSSKINDRLGRRYYSRKAETLKWYVDTMLRELEQERLSESRPLSEKKELSALRAHVESNPNDGHNRSRLVSALRRRGRTEEALEVARDGWNFNPDDRWLFDSYFALLRDLNKWPEALRITEDWLESSPNDVGGLLAKAITLERSTIDEAERDYPSRERLETVKTIYQNVIDSDRAENHQKATAWNGLGNVFRELGDFDRARYCYLHAQSLGLREFQVLNNLGILHVAMARASSEKPEIKMHLEQAEKFFNQAAMASKKSDDFIWPFLNLARLSLARGDLPEAKLWIQQVRSDFPSAAADLPPLTEISPLI